MLVLVWELVWAGEMCVVVGIYCAAWPVVFRESSNDEYDR